MRRSGLLVKMNLYLLSAVVLIFAITLMVIGYSTSVHERKKAEKLAELKAQKVASEVNNHLNQAMNMTQTLALSLLTLKEEGHASRPLALAILKRALEDNSNYYATWTMWEANAFDGKDAYYARKYHQTNAWFACSYYRAGKRLLKQNFGSEEVPAFVSTDIMQEYEDEYYTFATSTRQQVIIPPYYYSFTGNPKDRRLMTSVVVPIVTDGEVLGVVGTDIDLASLQVLIQQTKLYETGFVAIVSDNYKFVAHPIVDYLAQSIGDVFTENTDRIRQSIETGQSCDYQTVSEVSSEVVLRFFTPVNINNVSTPWSVLVEVPLREVQAESRLMVVKVLLIGVFSLLIVSLVISVIVKSITKPIIRSVHLARNISLGKLEEPVQLPVSNDEIGQLGEAFKHLAQKLKLMQQVSELGYWELNVRTHKMEWSDGLFNLLGYESQEFEPSLDALLDRVHPDDVENFKKSLLSRFCEQPNRDARFRIRMQSGTLKYVIMRCHETSDKSDRLRHQVGVVLNVTSLTLKELKLKESERKFRGIFNTSNDAILVINQEGNFIDANVKAITRSGWSRKELFKMNYRDIILKNKARNDLAYKQELFEGKEGRFETEYINARGRKIYLEVNGKVMKHKGEKVFLLISRDITERKQIEQKIIQAIIQTEEKERSHMAKELHDGVSPVLSTIKLYSNAIIDSDDVEFKKRITTKLIAAIEEAIKSIYEISNNLTPHILQNFGIVTALQTFIEKLEETTAVKYYLTSNLTERLPEKLEFTLYRVIIELLNNTIKHAGATKVNISIIKTDDIQLIYSDNGKGFDSEEVQKKKSSMGLFNITNRLKSMNATLLIESSPGKGMALVADLPIQEV